MSYQVKFTDTAKEDLRNIAIYIAEQSKEKKSLMGQKNTDASL